MKESTGQVLVQAPVEIANYLLNEKRRALSEIEQRHDAPILIVADDQLQTPHYEVTRIRENELSEETSKPSYHRGTPRKLATIALTKSNLNVPAAPAVTAVQPAQPAPIRESREEMPSLPTLEPMRVAAAPAAANGGFVGWLKGLFGSEPAPVAAPVRGERQQHDGRGRSDRNDRGGSQRRDGRSGGRQQGNRDGGGHRGGDAARRDEPRRNQAQVAVAQASEPVPSKQLKQQQPQQPQQPRPQKQNPPRQRQPRPSQQPDAYPDAPGMLPAVAEMHPRDGQDGELQKMASPAQVAASIAAIPTTTASTAPAIAPATEVDAAEAVAVSSPATDSDAEARVAAETEAAGESTGRRRRGRRGGRRRRRGGAEGAVAENVDGDDVLHSDEVAVANRSQPEFDFDEDASVVPVSSAARITAVTPAQVAADIAAEIAPVKPAPVAPSFVAQKISEPVAIATSGFAQYVNDDAAPISQGASSVVAEPMASDLADTLRDRNDAEPMPAAIDAAESANPPPLTASTNEVEPAASYATSVLTEIVPTAAGLFDPAPAAASAPAEAAAQAIADMDVEEEEEEKNGIRQSNEDDADPVTRSA